MLRRKRLRVEREARGRERTTDSVGESGRNSEEESDVM